MLGDVYLSSQGSRGGGIQASWLPGLVYWPQDDLTCLRSIERTGERLAPRDGGTQSLSLSAQLMRTRRTQMSSLVLDKSTIKSLIKRGFNTNKNVFIQYTLTSSGGLSLVPRNTRRWYNMGLLSELLLCLNPKCCSHSHYISPRPQC